MSESQDHDTHEGPIKTPKQLIWTVVASFVVPIAIIVLLINFVDSGAKSGAGTDSMSEEAVAHRIPDNTKKARLNCIGHLLSQIPYGETPRAEITLTPRQRDDGYVRPPKDSQRWVPAVY